MNTIENYVPYSFKSATVERHQLNVESRMTDLFKLSKARLCTFFEPHG